MKAILFDLDGTLVDTLPLYVESYNLALNEQGLHLTDKEIVDNCFGKKETDICLKLGISEKTEQFSNTYFEAVKNHYTKGKLFQGVIECLEGAKKKGIKLGIISYAYNWYVQGMISGLNIEKYFDIVIGQDDVKKAKPDPEAIFLACNRLNIDPQESLVVGDSRSDIVMGNAGGCLTCLFHPAGHGLFYSLESLKESKPTYVAGSFDELKELF